MAGHENKSEKETPVEPRGFGEHSRGLSGEYAHEQGWELDVEERTKQESGPRDIDGGRGYEYGARDIGDKPIAAARLDGARKPAAKAAQPKKQEMDVFDELRQMN